MTRWVIAFAVILTLASGLVPQPVGGAPPLDWDALGAEAVALLADYVKIDTTNPPGNEIGAARFLKAIFDREGIEARVIESAPGRANLYARLKGTGARKAVILLNHMDVVPADRKFWSVDPFGGVIKDGYLWGRGALDMKGHGILQLVTMLAFKRQGLALEGDVIFLAVADEEMGGQLGAEFMVREHFDLLKDASVVLNEGGNPEVLGGRTWHFVGVSEKSPLRLAVIASGPAGHGSTPRRDSAVKKLVGALEKIMSHETVIAGIFDSAGSHATATRRSRSRRESTTASTGTTSVCRWTTCDRERENSTSWSAASSRASRAVGDRVRTWR